MTKRKTRKTRLHLGPPKPWNPGRPTLKSALDEIERLRNNLERSEANNRHNYDKVQRLEAGMGGASAEVDRLRKDLQWHKHLIEHLVEKPRHPTPSMQEMLR